MWYNPSYSLLKSWPNWPYRLDWPQITVPEIQLKPNLTFYRNARVHLPSGSRSKRKKRKETISKDLVAHRAIPTPGCRFTAQLDPNCGHLIRTVTLAYPRLLGLSRIRAALLRGRHFRGSVARSKDGFPRDIGERKINAWTWMQYRRRFGRQILRFRLDGEVFVPWLDWWRILETWKIWEFVFVDIGMELKWHLRVMRWAPRCKAWIRKEKCSSFCTLVS